MIQNIDQASIKRIANPIELKPIKGYNMQLKIW